MHRIHAIKEMISCKEYELKFALKATKRGTKRERLSARIKCHNMQQNIYSWRLTIQDIESGIYK